MLLMRQAVVAASPLDVADDIVILNSGRVLVDARADKLRRNGTDLRHHLGVY